MATRQPTPPTVPPPNAVDTAFGSLAANAPRDPDDVEAYVLSLVAGMSTDEKVAAMAGEPTPLRGHLEMARRYNGEPIVAGANERRGLPGVRFTDGPRGIVMYQSTAFPSSPARAATFDPTLEERVGDAIGVEARTQGANLFAGVCINLLRHPAWGRAQETYGEDSYLLGEMGAGLVSGIQRHVMACVKHYALNSMENSRFWVDVQLQEADLRDLYLPHFKRCIDAGATSVMTAYNKVNGQWSGHHDHLINDILKGDWGFDGFTMSDFSLGVRRARAAVLGGQDLEMPMRMHFRRLGSLVRSGRIPIERIDDAVTRLVRAQVRFASRGEPERYQTESVAGPKHRALAREVATRSIVLLRNEPRRDATSGPPVLPLDPSEVRSIAVIGHLASEENLGDRGSSQVWPTSVVTAIDGLFAAGERHCVQVRYHDGRNLAEAEDVARVCDSAVVVAGSTHKDEGEWIGYTGGDRASLRLKSHDESLIHRVGRANPSTVVVLMGGSAFAIDTWQGQVSAILMAWYPGMEGGHAIADVLLGDQSPEGRLPCTWPTANNRLPPFRRFTRRVVYGPLFGYRLMEATGQTPAFWFGHGLDYAALTWDQPKVRAVELASDGLRRVTIEVNVTNAGDRAGVAVVQAYVPEVLGTHREPLNTLRGFSRVAVGADSSAVALLTVAVPGDVAVVRIGESADPTKLVEVAVPAG